MGASGGVFLAFLAVRVHRPFRISKMLSFVNFSHPRRASTIASIAGRLCCLLRKDSRIRRLVRFLFTAKRIFFLATTIPRRGCPKVLYLASTRNCECCTLKEGLSKTGENSLEFNSLWDLGKLNTLFKKN